MDIITVPILYGVLVINLILGLIIFMRGTKRSTNILFGFLSLSVSAWSFGIIGFYSENLKNIFNWVALTHSSALLAFMVLMYFSMIFPKRIVKKTTVGIISFIGFISYMICLYYLFFSDSIIGVTKGFTYQINTGYFFYQGLMISYFTIIYIMLFIQFRNADNISNKQQVRYIFWGSLFTSISGIITDLMLPATGIFNYTWLGPIFTLILVSSVFISILRYNLFNIKVILTEFISIILIVILAVEALMETNRTLFIIKSLGMIPIILASYLLIKSVYKEVEMRTKIEILAKDLESANAEQENLIHFITHQIKGFLSKSRNIYSMILEGDYGPISDTLKPIMQEGLNSETKGVALVKEILDSANLKKGTLQYNMSQIDFGKCVEEIFEEQKNNATDKGLNIKFDKEDGQYTMIGDIEQIRHVVKNLIDNSIKYTEKGEVDVKLFNRDDRIVFCVKDTGVGINPDDRNRLFTAGGKGKDSLKINVDSTGFGLFIVKKIVDDHKGKVWVESDGQNKGSSFFVEFTKS